MYAKRMQNAGKTKAKCMQKAGKTHAQAQSFRLQILLGRLRVFGHFLPRLQKSSFKGQIIAKKKKKFATRRPPQVSCRRHPQRVRKP